jgi:hypothetical protein
MWFVLYVSKDGAVPEAHNEQEIKQKMRDSIYVFMVKKW